MASKTQPKRATTPPKGRPTPRRDGRGRRRRLFGATAQWIAVALLITLAFLALWIGTGGGDLNPFNTASGAGPSRVAAATVTALT